GRRSPSEPTRRSSPPLTRRRRLRILLATDAWEPQINGVVMTWSGAFLRPFLRAPRYAKVGEDLAAHYRSADVFVFPSRTDTFGLVLLEAMASGTPSAAFPVAGPIDVITPGRSGVSSHDLRAAAL